VRGSVTRGVGADADPEPERGRSHTAGITVFPLRPQSRSPQVNFDVVLRGTHRAKEPTAPNVAAGGGGLVGPLGHARIPGPATHLERHVSQAITTNDLHHLPETGSDHRPVQMTIGVPAP
jgi:hypothetical protein